MSHRDLKSLTEKLELFLTQEAACKQAAKSLSSGTEIGIVISEYADCAFFNGPAGAALEARQARNPDVSFHLSPTAIDILCTKKGINLGELGVEVLRQYLAGEVKIKVHGSLFSIMKNGYIKIIMDAGVPFAKFLAEHGVGSLSKIPDIIKKLRG